MNQLNLYRGIYDENGNLFYEGHRFFWIKVHIKYLGETTSKFQFTSTIIAEYPDGTTYELGGINFIDRSLAENNEQHLTLNPGDEFDSWFYMKHTAILIQINIIFKVRFRNFLAETITVVILSNLTTLKKLNKL